MEIPVLEVILLKGELSGQNSLIRKKALKVLIGVVIWMTMSQVLMLMSFLRYLDVKKSQVNERPHCRSISETAIMSETCKKNSTRYF